MQGTEPSTAPSRQRQPVLLTAIKACALVVSATLSAVVAVGVVFSLTPTAFPLAALGVFIGYLGADMLSGTVHWFCDTFFAEDTPVIGRTVIWPFRDHHRHPSAITKYRLLEQDGTSSFILLAPLAIAWRTGPPDAMLALFTHAALCGFAAGALGTNLFHKWAHAEQAPSIVRWLQRRRLILSPDAHRVHYRTYTGGYCVTSGWLNAVLDVVNFFGRAERAIRWLQRLPAQASR